MQFTLTIELGNDAVDSPKDVAKALRVLADDVGYNGYGMPGDGGSIRDINGNTVGKWEVRETPEDDRSGDAAHLATWSHLA